MKDRVSKIINGLRPPVVSTQAPKGIRNNEPDREGMATRKPIITGLNPITSLNLCAVGPNKATAAKPMKKPSVALNKHCHGEPLIPFIFLLWSSSKLIRCLLLSLAAVPHDYLVG